MPNKKAPGPYALPPGRYPIGDVAHANFAITRLYQKAVAPADRKKVISAIRKRYPKNKNLIERIKKLIEKTKNLKGPKLLKNKKATKKKTTKKKTAKKKTAKRKSTKKGQCRKTSRKAYKGIKKKRPRKRQGGILEMLTSHI